MKLKLNRSNLKRSNFYAFRNKLTGCLYLGLIIARLYGITRNSFE